MSDISYLNPILILLSIQKGVKFAYWYIGSDQCEKLFSKARSFYLNNGGNMTVLDFYIFIEKFLSQKIRKVEEKVKKTIEEESSTTKDDESLFRMKILILYFYSSSLPLNEFN
jgi:hypothetical protein